MSFKTILKRKLKKLVDTEMYSPNEVAKLELVLNTSFEPSRHKVYRFIQSREIKATNMGTEIQPRWFVLGADLRKFVEKKYLA